MRIGYVRVSSLDQNPDRQIDELKLHQVEKVFMDKVSGKNLDRLARNLADLLTMVQDLTGRGVSVTFLNERLSFESGKDAFPTSKLMLSMIGTFAEFERSMIKRRQMEGIALAKERGVYKGRQRTVTEEQISKIRSLLDVGVPLAAAARKVGVSRSTAYKYLNMSEGNCHD